MGKADRRARKRQNQALAAQEREAMLKRTQRKKLIQRSVIVVVSIVVVVGAVSIFGGNNKSKAKPATTTTAVDPCPTKAPTKHGNGKTYKTAPPMTIDVKKTYTATIVTSCGTMVATLAAKDSPVAVNNFVFLAKQGFFDGLSWHRVVKDFVIQGGDPKGDGSGGPGYTVKGAVPKSGHYPLGGLAAAKTGADPNGTMGSQFFVVTGTQGEQLPAQYAYFGVVTTGLSAANAIEQFAPASDGPPTRPLYIIKITITEK